MPFTPSKFTLRNASTEANSKIAINAAADRLDSGLSSADFRFNGKYAKAGAIHKTQLQAASDIDSADALLNHIVSVPMAQIAGDVDADAKTLLTSTSLNVEVTATAVWSNTSTARAITDLDALMDAGGGAYNILWLGEAQYRELASLPALVAFAANYSAVDARAPKELVANFLMARYTGLEDVVIEGVWYNTVNTAQTVVTARQFDGVVWAGAREHCRSLEYAGMRDIYERYDRQTQEYIADVTMYFEYQRMEQQMGAVLTGH